MSETYTLADATMKVIQDRRSIRDYTDEPVSEEDIGAGQEAAAVPRVARFVFGAAVANGESATGHHERNEPSFPICQRLSSAACPSNR